MMEIWIFIILVFQLNTHECFVTMIEPMIEPDYLHAAACADGALVVLIKSGPKALLILGFGAPPHSPP